MDGPLVVQSACLLRTDPPGPKERGVALVERQTLPIETRKSLQETWNDVSVKHRSEDCKRTIIKKRGRKDNGPSSKASRSWYHLDSGENNNRQTPYYAKVEMNACEKKRFGEDVFGRAERSCDLAEAHLTSSSSAIPTPAVHFPNPELRLVPWNPSGWGCAGYSWMLAPGREVSTRFFSDYCSRMARIYR